MKNQLIRGTMILTGAGIATRLIGFGYRILLAGALGDTMLGVYQLIFPVYSICFTLYAAGIQTAVSQIISYEKESFHLSLLKGAMILSLAISSSLSVLLFHFSENIGVYFLGTVETIPLLRILSFVFPVCGITSVINGYFYGISNAAIPATTQIIEQLFRVGMVCITGFVFLNGNISKELAVAGLLTGETVSAVYNISRLFRRVSAHALLHSRPMMKRIFLLALPLSGSKFIIALLGSLESVLIPAMLIRSGCSKSDALAVFGILTGIVLPFLTFPGTITNSLSVLLLPAISHAAGNDEGDRVKKTTEITLHYTFLLGVLSSAVFLIYGQDFGLLLFQNENAGTLLSFLAWICPFLYSSTTLGSVINGLGKTGTTFLNTIVGIVIRIFFLIYLTPLWGIRGYLYGFMLSQILICILNGIYIRCKTHIAIHLIRDVAVPMIFSSSVLVITKKVSTHLSCRIPPLFSMGIGLLSAIIVIFIFLYKTGQIRSSDF